MLLIKRNKCSIYRILACVFIKKVITIDFSKDRDVGILYLSTKIELDRFNRDILWNRKKNLEKLTNTYINIHTHSNTHSLAHTNTNTNTHTNT